MRNMQEDFETMVKALYKQGGRSVTKNTEIDPINEKCLYRSPNGFKCAIGHLIPDDKYDKSIETFGVHAEKIMALLGIDYNKKEFYSNCQTYLHDNLRHEDKEEFRNRLIYVAKDLANGYNLDTKFMETLTNE